MRGCVEMDRDIRGSPQYAKVKAFYEMLFAPGSDHVHAIRDVRAGTDGAVYFTGLRFAGALEDGPSAGLYRFDRGDGSVTRLRGDGQRLTLAPCGTRAALLVGNEVEIVMLDRFATVDRFPVVGIPEEIAWSPDGATLALLVAGARADVAGAQGGYAMQKAEDGPAWLPEIDSGGGDDVWRRIWLWRPGSVLPTQLTQPPVNVWEMAWRDRAHLAVIASDHHGEGSWYSATLRSVDVATGTVTSIYDPADQIALPRSSPDGEKISFVEAVCSDRGIVCGTLRLLGRDGVRSLDTRGVEITDVHWVGPEHIAYAGLRGFETVVGMHNLGTGGGTDSWASSTLTCGEWYPAMVPDGEGGALVAIEGYDHPPALACVGSGAMAILHSFAVHDALVKAGRMEPLRWTACDGLEIHGWLIRPNESATGMSLLIDVHGGPIWAHRNRWMARLRAAAPLTAQGYAVLLPNPRGSAGRGQDFARRVIGDMGGADTGDLVSAIDHLVKSGLVDPSRVAVTGTSYGGFMSAWLVTRCDRFAAAIPISPVSDWYSQHYTSQIPSFDEICLEGSPRAAGGQYFDRSPAFFASGATTPTLTLAGGLDKNTPPTQALEFHRALLEAGCPSTLCVYPEDGHSLRGYPAYLESAARTMIWLDRHMGPPASPPGPLTAQWGAS